MSLTLRNYNRLHKLCMVAGIVTETSLLSQSSASPVVDLGGANAPSFGG